jgi:predicted RNA methylase
VTALKREDIIVDVKERGHALSIQSTQDGVQCLGIILLCTDWLQFGSSQHVLMRPPHVAQKARRRSDVIFMDITLEGNHTVYAIEHATIQIPVDKGRSTMLPSVAIDHLSW